MRELFATLADIFEPVNAGQTKDNELALDKLIDMQSKDKQQLEKLRERKQDYYLNKFDVFEYEEQYTDMLDKAHADIVVLGKVYTYSEAAMHLDWGHYSKELRAFAEIEFAMGKPSKEYTELSEEIEDLEFEINLREKLIENKQQENKGV